MGEYKGVKDNWMDVVSSQGSSLLSVYIVGSEVTDFGFSLLQNCSNLQALSFDCCDRISEQGIKQVSGSYYYSLSHIAIVSYFTCQSVLVSCKPVFPIQRECYMKQEKCCSLCPIDIVLFALVLSSCLHHICYHFLALFSTYL